VELAERLAYLVYYWRARLRWPVRLIGVLLLLLLAWQYPWHAYAVVVLAVCVLGVWLTPHMAWSAYVTQPMSAGIAAALSLFCYLLPSTSAWMVGATLWGLAMYGSWRFGLAGSALLLLFYFLPSVSLALLGVAIWLLFLIALPRLCLAITEFGAGAYFAPFFWPYLHVIVLCLLLSYSMPALLLPLGIVCVLLYFFPKTIIALALLFLLYQLLPLFKMCKDYFLKIVEKPYGIPEGDPPEKIKNGEEAVEVALKGKLHYEVLNSHRAATAGELKACYRRMALMLHPDKNPDEQAAVAFKRVTDAWDALSTPLARAEYDAGLDGVLEGDEEGKAAEADAESLREFARSGDTGVPSGPPGLKKRRVPPRTTKRR